METIKNKGIRYHIGCGGEVVGGTCLRCGERQEKKGLLKKVFGEGPVFIKKKDLEEIKRTEHRKRIRKGKDIFKR